MWSWNWRRKAQNVTDLLFYCIETNLKNIVMKCIKADYHCSTLIGGLSCLLFLNSKQTCFYDEHDEEQYPKLLLETFLHRVDGFDSLLWILMVTWRTRWQFFKKKTPFDSCASQFFSRRRSYRPDTTWTSDLKLMHAGCCIWVSWNTNIFLQCVQIQVFECWSHDKWWNYQIIRAHHSAQCLKCVWSLNLFNLYIWINSINIFILTALDLNLSALKQIK